MKASLVWHPTGNSWAMFKNIVLLHEAMEREMKAWRNIGMDKLLSEAKSSSTSHEATASQQPSTSTQTCGHNKEKENEKEKEKETEKDISSSVGRRSRYGFSMTSMDLNLEMEEESQHEPALRGVLQDCLSQLESAAASSKDSTSDSEANSRAPIHWRDFFRVFKKGSAHKSQSEPTPKCVPKLTRRKSRRVREDMVPALTSALDSELCCFKFSGQNFSFSELQNATKNFSKENLIGEGGYAEVYKGELPDGQLVAIKRLTRGSPEEMTVDFLSELGIIVHVDHPNIAKLIGYGVEGGMHLVLQLSPHGSLASLLYGPREKLDWTTRYKIALGTAEGLLYLHEGCQRRIIHKDIKASNILLTEDFEPQISDFGLAKWLPDQWTHHTVTKIEGTFGYLPPEFFMHGIVDEKTDVYAYGVLLLELITGKQALDSSQRSLVMWAKPLLIQNKIKELIDSALGGAYYSEQLNRLALLASMCIQQSSMDRPQMSQVVEILRGNEESLAEIKPTLRRTYSEELYDAEEYNSTKCLNDLHQHKQDSVGQCHE